MTSHSVTPYSELPEVQAHIAEHYRKRDNTAVEVRQVGSLHWEWRFYFGRYLVYANGVRWADYETGGAYLTEGGARRAATRHLKSIRTPRRQWRP